MKILQILFAIFCMVFFAGCYEISEEVCINSEKSARLKVDIGIYPQEMPVIWTESKAEAIREFRKDMRETMKKKAQNLKKAPYVESAEIEKSYTDKIDHYIYDVKIDNVYEIGSVYHELCMGQIASDENGITWAVDIRKLKNGNLLFTQKFINTIPSEEQRIINEKEKKLIVGKYYIVKLRAPKIVSSNGLLNKKKNAVEWKIPLLELPGDFPYRKELVAEIQICKWRVPLLFAVIFIVIIAGAYFIIGGAKRIRRKRT